VEFGRYENLPKTGMEFGRYENLAYRWVFAWMARALTFALVSFINQLIYAHEYMHIEFTEIGCSKVVTFI
jgi:hypothetical protein